MKNHKSKLGALLRPLLVHLLLATNDDRNPIYFGIGNSESTPWNLFTEQLEDMMLQRTYIKNVCHKGHSQTTLTARGEGCSPNVNVIK